MEKEQSGQPGPEYIDIVISHRWSGWTQWPTKIHRRSALVSPPHSSCWTTSPRGCNLCMSLWATLYPHLGWGMGQLPMTTRSGVSASLLTVSFQLGGTCCRHCPMFVSTTIAALTSTEAIAVDATVAGAIALRVHALVGKGFLLCQPIFNDCFDFFFRVLL
jgi:hypothetical protein